jgi:hypothetical protein
VRPEPGWIGSWSPGFGDPTVIGWLITCGYVLVGLQCRALAKAASRSAEPATVRVVSGARQITRAGGNVAPMQRAFFRWLAWALFFLGINKQLDFQTAFFQLAKLTTWALDLHALRRDLQLGFVLLLGLALSAAGVVVWRVSKTLGQPVRTATIGVLVLLLFVLVRALTFEHFAGTHSWPAVLLFESGLAEAAGLGCISWAARLQHRLAVGHRAPVRRSTP